MRLRPGMTIPVVAVVYAVALLSMTHVGASGVASDPSNEPIVRAILALDASIQQRFNDTSRGFGLSRMGRPLTHRFEPETLSERSTVHELEQAGQRVMVFLANRRLLGPKPDPLRLPMSFWIKGPVFITASRPQTVPNASGLWDEGQRALAMFDEPGAAESEVHKFDVDDWHVVARPVRATDTKCFACHQSDGVGVGDPLGVMLYVFQHLPMTS
jgi:hypothetical protein